MAKISVSFRRHGRKTMDGRQISRSGIREIKSFSKNINPSSKFYHSKSNRTTETALLLSKLSNSKYNVRKSETLRGHKYFSGKRIKTTKKDNVLTLFKKIAENVGVTDTFLIKTWLANKFPSKIIERPNVMADTIIKDRFKVPFKVKNAQRTIIFENITHDVVVAALFQRLSGTKYISNFKTLPKELESLRIDISPEGKAIMSFRDYHKDVTKKLRIILNS